jgi:hypothetical protein
MNLQALRYATVISAMTFDQIAEAYEAYLARREMLSAAEQAADQSLVAHPAIPPTRHWAAPWHAFERDERSSQPGSSASSVTKYAATSTSGQDTSCAAATQGAVKIWWLPTRLQMMCTSPSLTGWP